MIRTFTVILMAVALLGLASPAFAQSNEDKAFEYFDEGAKHYFDEEYEASIESFRNGFDLFAHPMFQVNIAISHWRLDELAKAIAAADLAASMSDQLEPPIAAENAARRHTFSVIRTTRDRAAAIAADEAAAAAIVERTPEPPPAAPEGEARGLSALGWTGVITAGAGVVLLGGWAITEIGLDDEVRALEDAGGGNDRAAYDAAQNDLKSKQTTARVLLGAGAVLTAVGGGLLVFDLIQPNEEVKVTLAPRPDGALVSATLRF